jgi:hypothetical protein
MPVELQTIYHRTPLGRVEAIDMNPREAAFAAGRWPDQWSLDMKTFSARAPRAERGEVVEMPSLVDRLERSRIWDAAQAD